MLYNKNVSIQIAIRLFYRAKDLIFLRHLHKCSIASILLIILCFCGCDAGEFYSAEFFAMDTVMTVSAYGSSSKAAVRAAQEEINRLDALLSAQNKKSNVYRLNQEKTLIVSDDMLSIINSSLEINSLTDGAFDITTQPLSALWGFYSGLEKRVPSEDEIKSVLEAVGSEHIKINGSKVTLDDKSSIDLGGIAKGYASQRAAKIFEEKGITSALISLGGNVRAVGKKPDGSMWKVAVTNPDDKNSSVGTLSVCDKAIITSGDYQRYFVENGKTYHHIIDASTGFPADSGLRSVTVVSEDDCLADALSTALFVMGIDRGAKLCRNNSDKFGAVFVADDGGVYVTQNLSDCFESQNGFEVV